MSFFTDRSSGKQAEYNLAAILESYNYNTTVIPLGLNSAADVTAVSSTKTLTFEVKADLSAPKTHNVAIEISRDSQPTGILTCSADYWAHAVDGVFYCFKTNHLKCISSLPRFSIRPAGDGKRTKVVLIPLDVFKDECDFVLEPGRDKPEEL
jgi:hypothetical protein